MSKLNDLIHFVTQDIWRIPEKELSTWKRYLMKPFRILALSIQGFLEDKVQLRASALTYYSLWAVVPILALLLGIARGFGFQNYIEDQIIKNFSDQTIIITSDSVKVTESPADTAMYTDSIPQTRETNVAEKILGFAYKYLDKTQEGFILGIGLIILFWSVINMLSHIENTFNDIWQIRKPRTILRKYTDYFGFMILAPVIIIFSAGANVFVTTRIEELFKVLGLDFAIGPITLILATVAPYVLYTLVFFLFYIVIPNTKVKVVPALIAGVLVGILFQFLQYGYINGQVYLSRINAVYGTFAALPLFLMFLQLGWVLVLYGAEFSFAIQNNKNFLYDSDIKDISIAYRNSILFYILYLIIDRFKVGKEPLKASEIADNENIPVRLVRKIMGDLQRAGLISEVNTVDDTAYQPAVDIDIITIQYVRFKMDNLGSSNFLPLKQSAYKKIRQTIVNAEEKFILSDENICIKDLSLK
ncbi:YhjD/YihY/BrkB family envelope integrity protein [Saccharicrinis sp. FJH54]|uniref:YhjD/YihY/BrkB family envelope integrity protein n=1 Tax=Saccharicrinis sp. FJH54 TaxID=3344665 RepID=UPI0035D45D9C